MPPIQPHRSTQSAWKQCACARHARLNRVKCTVARPKEVPLGEGGRHTARQNGPNHYPWGFKGPPTGAPPKPNASGFGGERRSNGMTELLPLKAKRRMWSLRRRGVSFSTIFLQTKKDGATGGRSEKRMPVKTCNLPSPTPNSSRRVATPQLFSILYSLFSII